MGKQRGRKREWGENGDGMREWEYWNAQKIAIKRNTFGIWRRPLGASLSPFVIHFRKLFSGDNITIADTIPLS